MYVQLHLVETKYYNTYNHEIIYKNKIINSFKKLI